MLRNAYTFVCTLFVFVFLFGLSSSSQASKSIGANVYAGPSSISLLFQTNASLSNANNFIYLTDGSFDIEGFYISAEDFSVKAKGKNLVATGTTVGYGYNLPGGVGFDYVQTTYTITQAPNGSATLNIVVNSYFYPSYTYYSSTLNYLGGTLQLTQ